DSPSPLGACAIEESLRRLDVHPLNHFIAKALGAAVERRYERLGALDLGGARGERAVTGGDLVRVDEAFAVETQPTARCRFLRKSLGIVEAVEPTAEHHDAR